MNAKNATIEDDEEDEIFEEEVPMDEAMSDEDLAMFEAVNELDEEEENQEELPQSSEPHGLVKPTVREFKNMADLWTMKKAATDAFNDAGKALGEKYDLDPTEIKSYVAAVEQDKLAAHERKMESRQILMDL